jgi:preprotein translocase subunit SecG
MWQARKEPRQGTAFMTTIFIVIIVVLVVIMAKNRIKPRM